MLYFRYSIASYRALVQDISISGNRFGAPNVGGSSRKDKKKARGWIRRATDQRTRQIADAAVSVAGRVRARSTTVHCSSIRCYFGAQNGSDSRVLVTVLCQWRNRCLCSCTAASLHHEVRSSVAPSSEPFDPEVVKDGEERKESNAWRHSFAKLVTLGLYIRQRFD